MIHDKGKLAAHLTITVSLCGLVALGRAEIDQVYGILFVQVGYLVGNGVLVVSKKAPSPMLVPNVELPVVATTGGPVDFSDDPADQSAGIADAAHAIVQLSQAIPPDPTPGQTPGPPLDLFDRLTAGEAFCRCGHLALDHRLIVQPAAPALRGICEAATGPTDMFGRPHYCPCQSFRLDDITANVQFWSQARSEADGAGKPDWWATKQEVPGHGPAPQ